VRTALVSATDRCTQPQGTVLSRNYGEREHRYLRKKCSELAFTGPGTFQTCKNAETVLGSTVVHSRLVLTNPVRYASPCLCHPRPQYVPPGKPSVQFLSDGARLLGARPYPYSKVGRRQHYP
jgi:hypothetical protein